jgi:YfiH family protein
MKLIRPQWPLSDTVGACTTSRIGGVSQPPWAALNLADHVGDRAEAVAANRWRLQQVVGGITPQWLAQVHGSEVVEARGDGRVRRADACWSATPGVACAVLTADCLPVLFADPAGGRVAAAHAGWRGLLNGVLEATLACFEVPARVHAWLGPAIGPLAFEVGAEVRTAFCERLTAAEQSFAPSPLHPGRWLADLYQLAWLRLNRAGVGAIFGGEYCTFTQRELFFSYRRDGVTGRMASLIWLPLEKEALSPWI